MERSGRNGAYFYHLIKCGHIEWDLFDLKQTKLSRFDIHYLRKGTDWEVSIYWFLKKCEEKIIENSRIRKVSLNKGSGGCILRIGSRKSPRFYRVYEKKEGLEFEIELKKEGIANFSKFFFSNQLENFEDSLSKEFYKRFSSLLILNTSYTDWLLVGCRKVLEPCNQLVTSYMGNNLSCGKEYLMQLIQFLSFLKNLKGFEERLGNQIYYLMEFSLREFMNFLNVKGKYQRIKTLEFLRSLQRLDPLTTNFSDTVFRSSIFRNRKRRKILDDSDLYCKRIIFLFLSF